MNLTFIRLSAGMLLLAAAGTMTFPVEAQTVYNSARFGVANASDEERASKKAERKEAEAEADAERQRAHDATVPEEQRWTEADGRAYELETELNVIGPGRKKWSRLMDVPLGGSVAGWPEPRVLAPDERIEDLERPQPHERALELFGSANAPNFWMAVYNNVPLQSGSPIKPGPYYIMGVIDGLNELDCDFDRAAFQTGMSLYAPRHATGEIVDMIVGSVEGGNQNGVDYRLGATSAMLQAMSYGESDALAMVRSVGCGSDEFRRIEENFVTYLATN